MNKPLMIDLFCGLGGGTEGALAEGFDCVGFDIERHHYGNEKYPAQLVLQDVLTIHGKQFRDAAYIWASPPCQAYSYRAMPWKRAKALPPPDNSLFEACFRIQREAIADTARDCPVCGGKGFVIWYVNDCRPCERCDGNGFITRHIPMVVENVKGAQSWVGSARWHYGSFYLWGDVPALMPDERALKNGGGASWFPISHGKRVHDGTYGKNPVRGPGIDGIKQAGMPGPVWLDDGAAHLSSRSAARKAASAQIAKIPFELSSYIARCFYPRKDHFPHRKGMLVVDTTSIGTAQKQG